MRDRIVLTILPVAWVSSLAVRLQAQPVTSLEEFLIQIINTVFQTNNILSGLLIIAVVWGGRWFGRVAWPDIIAFFKSKEETSERRFQAEIVAEAERSRQAQENDKLTVQTLLNLAGEQRAMVAVLETQRILLIHILRGMSNGSGKIAEKAMEEAASAAQDSRR